MHRLSGNAPARTRVVVVPQRDTGRARFIPVQVVRGRLSHAAVHQLALIAECRVELGDLLRQRRHPLRHPGREYMGRISHTYDRPGPLLRPASGHRRCLDRDDQRALRQQSLTGRRRSSTQANLLGTREQPHKRPRHPRACRTVQRREDGGTSSQVVAGARMHHLSSQLEYRHVPQSQVARLRGRSALKLSHRTRDTASLRPHRGDARRTEFLQAVRPV